MLERKTKKSIAATSNDKIIKVLETVKSHYSKENNTIHVNAYERAIYQIRKWPHVITRGKDVAHLEGIGKGMIQKIDTILATGTLPIIQEKHLVIREANDYAGNKKTKKSWSHVNSVREILGFSAKTAVELKKSHGIKTIEELVKLAPILKLTRIQRMGLRYHNDLQQKVARAEISEIGAKIEDSLLSDDIIVFLAGSYPSGLKKESKDIDILLVVRDSSKLKSKFLEELIKKLNKTKTLQLETITIGSNKFMGLVKLNDETGINKNIRVWRHLDMRIVDLSSFPYAWLYYSSGVVFNKLIREKIKKRGYKLNEWGLFKDDKRIELENEKHETILEKELFDKNSILEYAEKIEKEIFKLAHLEYKTIPERY
jgi:DNA polymerase/3'-5' exonuclease PolX